MQAAEREAFNESVSLYSLIRPAGGVAESRADPVDHRQDSYDQSSLYPIDEVHSHTSSSSLDSPDLYQHASDDDDDDEIRAPLREISEDVDSEDEALKNSSGSDVASSSDGDSEHRETGSEDSDNSEHSDGDLKGIDDAWQKSSPAQSREQPEKIRGLAEVVPGKSGTSLVPVPVTSLPTSDILQASHTAITISDDQSETSKVQERNLLALTQEQEGLNLRSVLVTKIPGGTVKRPPGGALADYQMQLMLLEQQNKGRLLLARQDTSNADEAQATRSIEVQGRSERLSAMDGRHSEKTGSTSSRWTSDTGDDPSNMNLAELNSVIEKLQTRARALDSAHREQHDLKIQTLHRIWTAYPTTKRGPHETRLTGSLLDAPETMTMKGRISALTSKLPVENFDLFLEQNKDISFIVYLSHEINNESAEDRYGTQANEAIVGETRGSIRPVSKDLFTALKLIFESRPEFSSILTSFRRDAEVNSPYLFMYFLRKKLDTMIATMDRGARQHFTFFRDYIQENHGPTFDVADTMISQGYITPGLIDFLFRPGDIIVQRDGKEVHGWLAASWPRKTRTELVSRRTARRLMREAPLPQYRAEERTTDSHDKSLDFVIQEEVQAPKKKAQTAHSDGLQAKTQGDPLEQSKITIADFLVFPLHFASPELIDQLKQRGKTVWKCRSRRIVSYQENESVEKEGYVEERYVIDLKTYKSLHRGFERDEERDELGPKAMANDDTQDERFQFLLPHKIKGYNLRLKKWHDLTVDRISDVNWNKEAFQKVVIDRTAKDLIRAWVSNQLATEVSTDLIPGKGNGLILLLHGGPGTGKTLTAESVAELAEKPLYRVTCGDIGTRAEDVEKYLTSVFHLGKLWGCVVLLDEADVFLEQRSLEDLQRNALVSVFLRVLEYYEGILILTSNRVGIFDEAFKSRIQLALHYPALGPYQRLRIWENFINRLESFQGDQVDIDDLRDHLNDLKEENTNGRQIRNAITTVRQYAKWKNTTMNYQHLKDVIEVSGRFDKYLDKLNGGFTQDQLAEDDGLRLA